MAEEPVKSKVRSRVPVRVGGGTGAGGRAGRRGTLDRNGTGEDAAMVWRLPLHRHVCGPFLLLEIIARSPERRNRGRRASSKSRPRGGATAPPGPRLPASPASRGPTPSPPAPRRAPARCRGWPRSPRWRSQTGPSTSGRSPCCRGRPCSGRRCRGPCRSPLSPARIAPGCCGPAPGPRGPRRCRGLAPGTGRSP